MKRVLITGALALALTATSAFAGTTRITQSKSKSSTAAATQKTASTSSNGQTSQPGKAVKKASHRRHKARHHKTQDKSMQTPANKKGAK